MAKSIQFKLFIEGPELKKEIDLQQGITTLGREPGNDIALAFSKISRRHARFECSETMCLIIDLESANGTLVDGVRIPAHIPTPLNDNAQILIDPVKIVCHHTLVELPEEPVEKTPEQRTITRKQAQSEAQKEKTASVPVSEKPPEAKPKTEEPPREVSKEKKPPAEPPKRKPPSPTALPEPEPERFFPPGLSEHSIRYLDYLPGIYQDEFMSRFLALFESIWLPLEWTMDHFDLFLNPATAPTGFLPWLSNWYELVFDSTWTDEQRRELLKEAHQIYARRGTRWALNRLLEIYTGQTAEIIEFEENLDAHFFKVILKEEAALDKTLVMRLIDANKPAHTSYALEFKK